MSFGSQSVIRCCCNGKVATGTFLCGVRTYGTSGNDGMARSCPHGREC